MNVRRALAVRTSPCDVPTPFRRGTWRSSSDQIRVSSSRSSSLLERDVNFAARSPCLQSYVRRFAWIVLSALSIAISLTAQPVPKITSVWPEWVQRGKTSIVMIEGENLTPVLGYVVSGEGGVFATNGVIRTQNMMLDVSGGG